MILNDVEISSMLLEDFSFVAIFDFEFRNRLINLLLFALYEIYFDLISKDWIVSETLLQSKHRIIASRIGMQWKKRVTMKILQLSKYNRDNRD